MYKKNLRPAIAMLELIFAIVIMAIVLMSAPMLISTAAKSAYVSIAQEAINEVSSQVNMIMGYHWDENNTNEDYIPPLLEVSNGDAALNEVNISTLPTGRRLGTPRESYRAFIRADGKRLGASSIGSGNIDKNDISDFVGITSLIEIEASQVDNIEKTIMIDINSTISYIEDNVSGGYNQANITYNPFSSSGGTTTNIKSITVTITGTTSSADELKKSIELRAFSCNIGGYKLEEKDF